jgi:hypothetical protein
MRPSPEAMAPSMLSVAPYRDRSSGVGAEERGIDPEMLMEARTETRAPVRSSAHVGYARRIS